MRKKQKQNKTTTVITTATTEKKQQISEYSFSTSVSLPEPNSNNKR